MICFKLPQLRGSVICRFKFVHRFSKI